MILPTIPISGGGRVGLATNMIASAIWLLVVAGLFVPKRQNYIDARVSQLTEALQVVQGARDGSDARSGRGAAVATGDN